MAAPSGTSWSGIQNSYHRLGIYISIVNDDSKTNVTIETWIWTKWASSDDKNKYYFDNESTSATTIVGENLVIQHTGSSGSGWSTTNQTKLRTHTYVYDRSSSDRIISCAAKLAPFGGNESTVTHTTSYTIPAIDNYTVAYDANGGTGAPSTQTKWQGEELVLSTVTPTKTGCVFVGWGISADASDASYEPGAKYTTDESIVLYAVWSTGSYVIIYSANGGENPPAPQTKEHGEDIIIASDIPTRAKYKFLGWGVSSTSTTVSYSAGDTYTVDKTIMLYAIWESSYSRPRISITTFHRSVESEDGQGKKIYTQSDVGTFFTIKVYYEVDAEPVSCKIEWRPSGGSSWSEAVAHDVSIPSDTYGYSSTLLLNLGNGEVDTDKTYYVRAIVFDEYDNSSITLTLPGTKYAIDFLAGGNGAAFGKPAETEGMLEIDWITRINAIMSAEDISADGSILASKGEFDTLEASTSISSPLGTFTRLYDAKGTKYSNGIASYGGSSDPINPDTTLEHLVLTNTNTPNGGFMFIKTEFYQSKTDTSNRVQTALPYNSDGCPYMRRYYNNAWTSWIPLHAGPADVCSKTGDATTTTSTSLTVAEWTVTEAGVYGVSGYVYWAANSSGYRVLLLRNVDSADAQIGAAIAQDRRYNVGSGQIGQNVSGFRRVAKGTKIRMVALQNSGGDLAISPYVFDIVKISP